MKATLINKIAAFIMVGFLLFILIKRNIIDENKIESNFKFSEAVIYKIFYPVDGGPDAEFQYTVNKKIYKNRVTFNPINQKITVGNKFLLKYYPPNPNISRILLDKPLP